MKVGSVAGSAGAAGEVVAERARVKPGDRVPKLRQRLWRYREPLIVGCLQEAQRVGEANDIVVAAMVLRLLVDEVHPTLERQAQLAEGAGFITLRIFDGFEGQSSQEMYLRDSDTHATPKGHRLIADELYEKMLGEPRPRAMLLGETVEGS